MPSLRLLLLLAAVALLLCALCDASRESRRRAGRRRSRGNNNNGTMSAHPGSSRTRTRTRTRGSRTRARPSGASGSSASRSRSRGSRVRRPPAGCEEIVLPMCKGLIPYTHTKLPNAYNHTTQLQAYGALRAEWAAMDHACSKNLRVMLCARYLPRCTRRGPGFGPCKKTCMRAKKKCARPLQNDLRINWSERGEKYSCTGLPSSKCVKPVRDVRCPAPYPNPSCVANAPIAMCANLTFTWGTVPNMFHQCHLNDINTEVSQYQALVATNCHLKLPFFLCGVHSPFCIRGEQPFTFPCKELCDEIRSSCESHYTRLYGGLPWPDKLQCHRYPTTTSEHYTCVMPDEGALYGAGGARREAGQA